jgi:UDPglucose 6-dehydrogenase
MKLAVVGTGYVGLVTGTCFADSGNKVICVDNNEKKVEMLRNKQIPIYEPGIETLFERSVREGRLTFTTDLEAAVKHAEVIFLCLPTPPGANGQADLSFVLNVAEQIGPMLDSYKIIVNKSTVPVGTADLVRDRIAAVANAEFDVVSNPEFLREGAAIDDFLKPERVVIGTQSPKAMEKMQLLYEPFVRSGNPIIFMDERSSELTKYAANAFLATKISFMNEIANLCERVGANVDNVRRGIGTDSRIGKRFLFAGIGYGGSCFPKDVQALGFTADEYDYDFKILDAVMAVNDKQRLSMLDKINGHFGDVKGVQITVWGLAFKAETDDVREAPALYLVKELVDSGASVIAYDPEASKNFKDYMGADYADKITYASNPIDAMEGSDALLICTDWNEFRRPNFEDFKEKLKTPLIFDGRNLYDLGRMEKAGIHYYSVGRKTVIPNP